MKRCLGLRFTPKVAVALLATMYLTAEPASADPSLSAEDLAVLKEAYKRSGPHSAQNGQLVDLGRILFWDPRLSASGKTACASCHFPYLGWGVTDAKSRNDAGRFTSRKSQPLIGLGHAEGVPVGWDGRNASLEAQAKASVTSGSMSMRDTDAPVAVEVIEQRIQAVPEYAARFEASMPGAPINIDTMAKAIAAFERSLEPGLAAFDYWIEGDEGAISDWAKRGFALFNGRANCSRCHAGWRFTDDLFHDIGTSTTDLGRGRELKTEPLMQYAFKTPTLRSVALRPPYMHNASAADLDQVIRHYEKGGIDRPSRSPLMEAIQLSDEERRNLVAFLQTLTGLNEIQAPPKLPGQVVSAQ